MASRSGIGRLAALLGAIVILGVLLFVSGYLVTLGDYKVANTVTDDPTLPYIKINGYRFHGQAFGNPLAPVVIVVHGGPGWDYRTLLPLKALADEYFVVFYDQRGSGLSPRVGAAAISLDSALADLDAIVDRFRGDRTVALVGHSWGAMLVTAYLGRAPQKVSHAVLAEPGFLNTELLERSGIRMGPRWEAGYLFFAARRWFQSLHIDGPDVHAAQDYFIGEVAARANPGYYCDGNIPALAIEHWRAGAVAMRAMFAANRDADGKLELDFTVGLERFTNPVLLLASECNSLIGVEHQRVQGKFFPASQLRVIPNSGHMMFVEQTKTSLVAVREYLAEKQ